jgi:hypothetical protein
MKETIGAAVVAATLLASIAPADALERKPIAEVDTDQLTKETQVAAPDVPKHMNLVWWIPSEFWQAIMVRDRNTPEAHRQRIVSVFGPYSTLAVVQADVSDLGAFRFYGKEEVEANLDITYASKTGSVQKLAPVKTLDPDLQVVLAMFTPILSMAAGNLGQNLHFFVLEDRGPAGERRVDPYAFGRLTFRLKLRSGRPIEAGIDLPLDSLHVPRMCPEGKKAHVSWSYCPWTGTKLAD